MIDHGKVTSFVMPETKVIDDYSVWVNSDIKAVTTSIMDQEFVVYEYNQIQYEKNEYIKMIDNKNEILEAQVTDTQLALCEVYEMIL